MHRPNPLMLAIVAVLALGVYGCFGLTKHAIECLDSWKDAAPAKGKVNALLTKAEAAVPTKAEEARVSEPLIQAIRQYSAIAPVAQTAIQTTAANINRPCRGAAGPDACGTLAQANKVMVRVGDEIATTQVEQRAVLPHVTASMDALTGAASGLKQNADSMNAILGDQAIQRTLANLESTTAHVDGVTADVQRTVHKFTDPPPCKGKWCWLIVPGKTIWALRDLPEPLYYMREMLP